MWLDVFRFGTGHPGSNTQKSVLSTALGLEHDADGRTVVWDGLRAIRILTHDRDHGRYVDTRVTRPLTGALRDLARSNRDAPLAAICLHGFGSGRFVYIYIATWPPLIFALRTIMLFNYDQHVPTDLWSQNHSHSFVSPMVTADRMSL